MRQLIKLFIILILLSVSGCKTVYKPIYIRAEIPEPGKIPYENPVYKQAQFDGNIVFYLDIPNSKLELKRRNAVETYIKLLENTIKINNKRASEDKKRFEELSGEKLRNEAKDNKQ